MSMLVLKSFCIKGQKVECRAYDGSTKSSLKFGWSLKFLYLYHGLFSYHLQLWVSSWFFWPCTNVKAANKAVPSRILNSAQRPSRLIRHWRKCCWANCRLEQKPWHRTSGRIPFCAFDAFRKLAAAQKVKKKLISDFLCSLRKLKQGHK